jgi:hypothetical protein
MVLAVAAAAGGQGSVIARTEGERERSCSEEEDQQDGKGAPHPWTMVHEALLAIRGKKLDSGIIDAS